jgi:hypothetical protein
MFREFSVVSQATSLSATLLRSPPSCSSVRSWCELFHDTTEERIQREQEVEELRKEEERALQLEKEARLAEVTQTSAKLVCALVCIDVLKCIRAHLRQPSYAKRWKPQ